MSSAHGLIHLLIEKDFVWLTRQKKTIKKFFTHSLPWPFKKKERVFDQNRVVQSLFVDKELYNI